MKRAKPIPFNELPQTQFCVPRKIRVIELEDTSDEENYAIIKYSNLQFHSPTKDYLTSKTSLKQMQIEDKSVPYMSLVDYDPAIHFAPINPV